LVPFDVGASLWEVPLLAIGLLDPVPSGLSALTGDFGSWDLVGACALAPEDPEPEPAEPFDDPEALEDPESP
jgi:hypothetical protein